MPPTSSFHLVAWLQPLSLSVVRGLPQSPLRQGRSPTEPGPLRARHADLPVAGEVQDGAGGALNFLRQFRVACPYNARDLGRVGWRSGLADAPVLAADLRGRSPS